MDVLIQRDAMTLLTSVIGDLFQCIKEETARYQFTIKLLEQVKEDVTRRFRMEDGVLYAKGRRSYVPNSRKLRQLLLKETHDTAWTGHLGWRGYLHSWCQATIGP